MRSGKRRPAMGDEKRHVDHLEEAAHKAEADLRDDLEKAVEFE